MRFSKKYIWMTILLFVPQLSCVYSQVRVSLEDALNKYIYNSDYLCIQNKEFESQVIRYDLYKKEQLPSINFAISPISFTRSMRLLQNFLTGEYSNVLEYSNSSSFGITLSQTIPSTGGKLSLSSMISNLLELSNQKSNYSTIPFFINYSQSLFGGRKELKYQKTINNIEFEVAKRNYIRAISNEQQKVLSLYLTAYTYKNEITIYEKIKNVSDTILVFANQRLRLNKISSIEYDQIKLENLNFDILLEESNVNYENAVRLLENELKIYNIEIDTVSVSKFPSFISEDFVKDLCQANNPIYLANDLAKLNSELNLYSNKIKNRFNATFSLSYGLNQYSNKLKEAYHKPDQQQSLTVNLNIPIFQWGANKKKIKIAQNEYESTIIEDERIRKELSEQIHNYVATYNNRMKLFEQVFSRFQLSEKIFSTVVIKYANEKLDVWGFEKSLQDFLMSKMELLEYINELYEDYFKIRHLCLYDFISNKNISDQCNIYTY